MGGFLNDARKAEVERAITQAREIASSFSDDLIAKYPVGQIEHGGNLYNKPVLREIREELLDLVAYAHVHEQQVMRALAKLDAAFDRYSSLPQEIREARNLLRFGNEEGVAP